VEIDVASGKTTAVIDKGAGFANDWLPDGGFLLCTDQTGTRLSLLALGEHPGSHSAPDHGVCSNQVSIVS
jgi:hypothetical protein